MDKTTRRAVERHFKAIEQAKDDRSFFVSIAECVRFINITPLLRAMASKLEMENGITEGSKEHWKEGIEWFREPASASETWEKMLFVHRIYLEGEKWLTVYSSKPHDRELVLDTRSAISELEDLKTQGKRDNLRRPFFRRSFYETGINAVHDFFLDVASFVPRHQFIKMKDGMYYYEGKLIDLPTNSIIRDVFEVIFHKSGQNGFVSYETIEKGLREKSRLSLSGKKSVTRIQNAISESQGLFRFAQIADQPFLNITPDQRRLIEIVRGKGVQFNNERLV